MLGPIEEVVPPEFLERFRKTVGNQFKFAANVQAIVLSETEDMKGKVACVLPDLPFPVMMVLAEYVCHLCAQQSGAGYEKALDLIRDGAMTYRTKKGIV